MFVRVLAGPYKDTEGVIEDVQPECSAVRIGTREGNAFAMLDDLKVIPTPGNAVRVRQSRNPLVKK
jgi:hypothetical protein